MIKSKLFVGFLGLTAFASSSVYAVQITDNLQLGGAIRARIDFDPDRDIEKFNFDTIRLYAKYNSEHWIGAVQYRFYGKAYPYQYTDKVGDVSFAEYAWVGYKFDDHRQIQVGLNQVPFGLLPYFSSSVTETLGYPLGLEDVYQLGTKYIHQTDNWNFQGGFYARAAWQGKGTSRGGVTYSNVASKADDYVEDGSNNQDRNTLAFRAVRNISLGDWQSELGGSILTSTLKNTDTNDNGRRNAVAIHATGKQGPWSVGLLAARQQMSPRNPDNDDLVTFGGYDSSYNVASRGNLYTTDLNYDIAGEYFDGWINNVKLYGNYSTFIKSGNDYRNTQRYILGASFMVGQYFYIATDWLFGKNDPYIGGSSYTQSLGVGGTDHWENQATMNIGFYF